jgi:uncharacterized membrane protein
MSPEAEDVRGKAVLWTVLNAVSFFITGFTHIFALIGAILAGVAIAQARDNPANARSLVRWSWILFIIGWALGLLLLLGILGFFLIALAAGAA